MKGPGKSQVGVYSKGVVQPLRRAGSWFFSFQASLGVSILSHPIWDERIDWADIAGRRRSDEGEVVTDHQKTRKLNLKSPL